MQLLLTNKWGPYQLVGPFCDGVIGPITQRSGRTPWQALDQPINTNPPGGWIQAATLGVHNWSAISVYNNGNPNRTVYFLTLTLTLTFSFFVT